MSTGLAPAPSSAVTPRRSATHREQPARRGRLVIADSVVEKIAGQAAAEIGTVHGRTGGVLGLGAHDDRSARPDVDVDVRGSFADVSVKVGVAYPGSIRKTTSQLREHVTRRVRELTGVEVHRLDVEVTFLSVAGADTATRKDQLR
ncbi:Asp23/Gls24 family envelope stress response protein [Microlunatus antarcticus]|uniref:Putative alkaline shock family protein YloU n=1 Tax=Microlunatus antarcticus TaxID=53388 RepID=A0A7W5JWA2_9ACTN|nr:Asp23/Gls24 family envelope stress response protein [Microlunatus antarcticus]MBB3327251.1 putative alkaline shock family protein YloU [Microlunatus antarcticus]